MTKHTAFEQKLSHDHVTGCLNWTLPLNKWGYGSVKWKGKTRYAHRVAYERIKGPIPEGMTIDHLCRNTRCCNPDHLEAVTLRENLMRGTSFSAINAAKSHCKHGHPFDERNTYVVNGRRSCRMCNALSVQKYKGAA